MKELDLRSPKIGAKGHVLRRLVANAISTLQVSAKNYQYGIHPHATDFINFLTDAITFLTVITLRIPVLTLTPTSKSYSIATGATAGPALAKGGSSGAATYVSDNTAVATVNSSTGVVTGVSIGTANITATVAADSTYRQYAISYVATVTA